MPRKRRMYLPGIPAHVVQRDNNRDACFFDEQDCREYLNHLGEVTIMKRKMLSMIAGVIALVLPLSAYSYGQYNNTSILSVVPSQNGIRVLVESAGKQVTPHSSCHTMSTSGIFMVDYNMPGGKEMYSTIMLAITMGKQIHILGDDTCIPGPYDAHMVERVRMVYLL